MQASPAVAFGPEVVSPTPPLRSLLTLHARQPGRRQPAAPEAQRDASFAALLRASRETGGLMRGDEVAALLTQRQAGSISQLARWIVTRQVLSFEWRGELWIPMFQFDLSSLALRPMVADIAADKGGVVDGWMLTHWFLTPHLDLHSMRPADVLTVNPEAVRRAASDDLFLDVGE